MTATGHFHDQPTDGMDELYREHLLDRYREPRHRGRPETFDLNHRELNVSCGDTCEIFVRFDGDRAAEPRFEGHGCAISMAAADLLMEAVAGKTAAEIAALTETEMLQIVGVPVGPARLKCATLALKTLQKGLLEKK